MTTMGMVSGFESLVLVGTIRLDSGWSANRSVLALSYWQTTTTHRSRRTICDRCCTSSGCGCYGGSCSWGCSWCPGAGRPDRGRRCARCYGTDRGRRYSRCAGSRFGLSRHFLHSLAVWRRHRNGSGVAFHHGQARHQGPGTASNDRPTADRVIPDCIVQYIFAWMHILSTFVSSLCSETVDARA
jgi:hypothetical protein